MLKLKINTTRQVSTSDLRIACDPPLFFEVRSFVAPEVVDKIAEWERAGSNNAEVAVSLVAQTFVTISQDGESYPLTSLADVTNLRETIEAASPGQGGGFICALLEGFTNNHFRFFRKERPGSPTSPQVSENGNSPAL